MSVSGSGTWKSLVVADAKTGEVKIEKKFYKTEFDSVLRDPEYAPFLDSLLENAMVRKMTNSDEMSVDPESYEEVRAISLEMESDIIDPDE